MDNYEQKPIEFSPLDTALLGLKFELIEHLQNAGFNWFTDFGEVDVDMSNAEIRIMVSCDIEDIRPSLVTFQQANGFARGFFAENGHYYLRRDWK